MVVDKQWEADPVLFALLSTRARPKRLPNPSWLLHPHPGKPTDGTDPEPLPRAVFTLDGADIEVWCIEDLMTQAQSSSNSPEKMRVLPRAYAAGKVPDFVVSVSTASYPGDTTMNGCVVVGSDVLLYDPYADTLKQSSPWGPRIGFLQTSPAAAQAFDIVTHELRDQSGVRHQIESRLLPVPLDPASERLLLAAPNYLSLSIVNVTEHREYAWADRAGLQAARAAAPRSPIGSLETTHGLVRLQSEAPFVFVSGIADRVGSLAIEVTSREYAQTVAAAHNAGIATAWFLPAVVDAATQPAG
ncbi:MAG: hypothetical protein M3336_06645 [Chloroflexota bacterium]|nr:hypothetical protein [Chloroflexota bacterium]